MLCVVKNEKKKRKSELQGKKAGLSRFRDEAVDASFLELGILSS